MPRNPPGVDDPSPAQRALAEQLGVTMKALATGCTPVEAAEGDLGMLEAGLQLCAEALASLDDLAGHLRQRRIEYFLALSEPDPETGRAQRSQPQIAALAGCSDVYVNRMIREARTAAAKPKARARKR